MSDETISRILERPSIDPQEIELVRKIIEKTKAGKIRWNRTKVGYHANLPGFLIQFSRAEAAPVDSWANFSVTTGEGKVISIDNRSNPALAILSGLKSDPLVSITAELFSIVRGVGQGVVDRAIKALDKL